MRKANFKALFHAGLLVVAFILAGASMGHAQIGIATNTQPEIYGPLKADFVSALEAETILEGHLLEISASLQGLPQGSPAYQATYRASVYYRMVLQSVKGGKNVPDSIMDGIGMFTSSYFTGASYSEKLGLRQESVNLLDQ